MARDEPDVSDAGCLVWGRLRDAGFEGAYGFDLFRVPVPGGGVRLHLSEINARRTFGHVAHDLAAKFRALSGIGEAEPVTLRFGKGAPPDGTIPLLLPGTDDDTSAWLEVPSRHAGCV